MLRFVTALLAAALCAGCSASTAPAPDARADAAVAVSKAQAAKVEVAKAAPAEATQPSADGWVNYGGTMSDHEAMAASAVITAPDSFIGKTVKVSGEVSEVCKSMGCWLTFQHEGEELTVNMADHAFSVDKKGAGAWCEAEGEVVRQGELVSLTAHAVRMKPKPAAPAAPDGKPEGKPAPSKG